MSVADYEPFLTFEVKNDITVHMLENPEEEVCGVITFSSDTYSYERCDNLADDKSKFVEFGEAVSMRINIDPEVVAYVHTHPKGPANPSKHDMLVQAQIKKPSVIAALSAKGILEVFSFGDHLLDVPLVGRVFQYGVLDCYEAFRSWKWQKEGVLMYPMPRHNGWWNVDEAIGLPDEDLDMYAKYYGDHGYRPFEPNFQHPHSPMHPQPGDALLMQLGSSLKVINHVAVYEGNGLIYHHRVFKRSGSTPVGYYLNNGSIRQWVRHESKL